MSKTRLLACAALLALFSAPFANAQTTLPQTVGGDQRWGADRGRNESVTDRARPDYASPGIDLGAFNIRPSAGLEVETNSNIFFQPTAETSDLIFVARPRIDVATTTSRHQIVLAAGLDDFRYQDSDSEDHTDVYVDGEGRLDVRRGTYLVVGGGQSRRAESRSAPDAPGAAAKPVRIEDRRAFVAGVHEFGRARATLRLEKRGLNFKDAPLVGGGVADQDIRDYTVSTLTGRLELALSPDTAILGEVSGNKREFEVKPPRAASNLDSEGSSFLIGVNTDISNLVRGEVAVGYMQQNYNDPRLPSPKGLALQGKVEYFATPLTSITVTGRRRIDETVAVIASSFVSTEFGARIDHELRRNILLTAGVASEKREFDIVNRDDNLVFADAGARFLLNRRVELGARWRFERQDSSGAASAQDYDVNRFVVSAGLRF